MNDHPPHRLCECRKCMEYFTPLPDCDAFAAPGKPIAEQTNTQFMEGYRIGLAEMREKCAKACEKAKIQMNYSEAPYNQCAAAIRAIKFEGDTGFRPVSEMIAEHKQDPKKAAAIEKAKMRKAEQEPVPTGATHYQPHQKTYYKRVSATEWYLWSCTGKGWLPSKGTSDSSEWIMLSPIQAHQPAKPAEQEPVAVVEITYGREPECYVTGNIDDFPEGVFKLYAAPVRTKDLTDDELWALYKNTEHPIDIMRAVIAADREANK